MSADSKSIYKEYLKWFEILRQTPSGVQKLRDCKAFATWGDSQSPVEPYPYAMWYIMDAKSGADFEAMDKRANQNRLKKRHLIQESYKHVGGNINNPLLNEEYMTNAKAWHAENDKRRAADPEWQAHDKLTNEAARISQSGPNLYEAWEKANPKVKEHVTFSGTPILPKRPGAFKRFFMRLFGRDPYATLDRTLSYAEKQELWKEYDK